MGRFLRKGARATLCLLLIVSQSEAGQVDIPILDVSSFRTRSADEQRELALQVDSAFKEFGFAVMTGHGVSDRIFDAVYLSAKDFFHQPMDMKRQFDHGLGYGFGGYINKNENGGQLTGEVYEKNQTDAVESLTCRGLQHLRTHLDSTHKPAFAQDMSCVPTVDRLPSSMVENVRSLHGAFLDFKRTMTSITELALGVQPGELLHSFVPEKGGIRFAYYPQLPDGELANRTVIDYGSHADSGSLVFLRLDRENPSGTEVWHRGQWLTVPSIPNAVVVNLGTVLSRFTGGRWRAAIHRATRKTRNERLSIVYGAMVPNNELVLFELRSPQEEAGRNVTVKEYLDARVRLQRPDVRVDDRELVDFIDRDANTDEL